MIESLKQWAIRRGERLVVVPAVRLADLQAEITAFREQEALNGFQKWITGEMYQFSLPETGFPVRSVILMALPHPFYAPVDLTYQGKTYSTLSLVISDFDRAERDLCAELAAHGLRLSLAPNLPLKRLAVKSGLAVYGRNNISYVEGLGSQFSLAAYFSDLECADSAWLEVRQAERCAGCSICLRRCPTGAIRADRFLIDNERCLSNLNESPGAFPAWLPLSVHHTLYDCLQCQLACPLNREYLDQVAEPVHFSAVETQWLLTGAVLDAYPAALQAKVRYLGMSQWLESIPRNLLTLFQAIDRIG